MSGDQVATLANTITGNEWVAGGLSAGGGMAALDATMRPIDALGFAGLGFLTAHVQPLQDVVDRMAGQAPAINSFADAWQRVSTQVDELQQRLARAVGTDTARWRGDAGDRYRSHAEEITAAMSRIVSLASAAGSATTTMGQALASGRQQAGDLLADLVARLVSFVAQAIAAEGGLTSNVLAQATNLINSYSSPIATIEQQVGQTVSQVTPLLTALASAMNEGPTAASAAVDAVVGGTDSSPVSRGFVLAQSTGGGAGGGSVIRLPDGKTLRLRPGGEYYVPLGSRIFTGGQERLVPNISPGTRRLPDGTVIHFVDPDEVPES